MTKLFKTRVAESTVESYFCKRWILLGGITLKYIQGRGIPDRIAIMMDRVWLVELKAPDGRLSELQKETHAKLRAKGVKVLVLWSKELVDKFLGE